MKTINVAIIGCGAIAESYYIPALSNHKDKLNTVYFIDRDTELADKAIQNFGGGEVSTDLDSVLDVIDAGIVCLPNTLHYSFSKQLLEAGCHVMCEKPLTLKPENGKELASIAEDKGVLLSVNNTRRLFPSYQLVKELIDKGAIGELKEVYYYEGGEFSWPTKSGFYFTAEDPKGVLLDRGAHVLDAICHWIGGKPELIKSENDSFGGPEAVADITFRFKNLTGRVRLSWLYKQENIYKIVGTKGVLTGEIYDWKKTELQVSGKSPEVIRGKKKIDTFSEFGNIIVTNFLNSILGKENLIIEGKDVIDSIEWLEECYDQASAFETPWYS